MLMQPRISRLVVVAMALCAAAAATVASANPAASTQRFTLTAKTVHGKDGPTRVTAAGPIRGVGSVQVKSSPDNRIDHMTLQLARGTVLVVATEKSFAVHPDLRKCIATTVGHGIFTIDGGTDAFRGARGHGTYQRRGILIGARNAQGSCLGRKAPPAASSITEVMTGTAALGSA
jgi:hypothetical protein